MDDVEGGNGNGIGTDGSINREKIRRAQIRAREMGNSALSAVSDTPGWVWAVVGGVILLMIGILAASRYRARHPHDDHS